MPSFSWEKFCKAHRIDYVAKGPNVKQGNINIKCPFCTDDPSYHMCLSLSPGKPFYSCWRDSRHAGVRPAYLVSRLLRIGLSRAIEIVGDQSVAYADDLMSAIADLQKPTRDRSMLKAAANPIFRSLSWPSQIKPIGEGLYSQRFLRYLEEDRGFPDPEDVARRFDLRYALVGKWAGRVILPVRVQDRLVTWTGRDISGRARLRYLTLPQDEAIISIHKCLLFEDDLVVGGDVLYLVEGPFDALKLAAYLPDKQHVTCFFGMPTQVQVRKLLRLAPKFRLIVSLLDPDAWLQNLTLWHELSGRSRAVAGQVPSRAEDPGDMTRKEVLEMADLFLQTASSPATYDEQERSRAGRRA